MKNGAANINTVDVYSDTDYKVSYFTFKAYNLGV
jgi:citrate lyase synthetase